MSHTGIVAFAFGSPASTLSNIRIAEISVQQARQHKAPVYTQLDVPVDLGIVRVQYAEEKQNFTPTTLRLARGAVEWTLEKDINHLKVIAAQPHLWRCLRDLNMASLEANAQLEIRPCKEIMGYFYEEWFCANSSKVRTRSRKSWDKRERILKIIPYWMYKCMAG